MTMTSQRTHSVSTACKTSCQIQTSLRMLQKVTDNYSWLPWKQKKELKAGGEAQLEQGERPERTASPSPASNVPPTTKYPPGEIRGGNPGGGGGLAAQTVDIVE